MKISETETPPDNEIFDGEKRSRREFVRRVLIVVGIIAAVALLLLVLWQGTQVILLIFAGLLVGIFLRGIADFISRHTPLSKNWALAAVLLGIIAIVALVVWLLMPSIQKQYYEISEQMPQMLIQIRLTLERYPAGQWLLQNLPEHPLSLDNQTSNLFGRITGFFSSFLGSVVNLAIVLTAGIYLAFNPDLYYEGALKLFPQSRQRRVREVFDTIGFTLRNWMLGRITIMTINGSITALGLWWLGVPLALPLGLITGILNFIPNIGPFLAATPAILIALTQSPAQAGYTAILFLFVQSLEGYVLTPLIQQKAVELPPVLIIAAQLLLGILFGFLGVLLAVPIIAVFFLLVKMLYVEDLLGNQVKVSGEKKAKEQSVEN